ncbi:hypothetical protein SAMD00079811_39730 [Scytonema sp. HK-05]|uniref:hypothetical protein n=1 Tax=Scytonema sp. HK-05 TaxID=1137095 RepID=UPI00093657F8|nr:hypothetical protein [Scytonema sp. HK-05]OKH60984.1 hypothetical protein NIES2130_00395 [Scytonema sp. HK-05]BAY46364.1 hypothetical protein SAMD00079811_39730 [Scytonema sp. HK-05]
MSDKIYPPHPQEADTLLAGLLEEVKTWEGTLAGGTKLGVGAAAVESLVQTKVEFGNPRNHLILLTEEIFKDIGVELNSIYRQQMRDAYDFYYMTVTVDLRPKPGARFSRLCCELVFSSEGENEPIVEKIFPNSKWRSVMKLGVGMNLGLNGNLDWSVGIDASQVAEIADLPGNLKANVASNNELKAFIVVSDYAYEVGGFEILAQGEGNSTCYWRIEEPDIQKMATVKFAIVFKVSKGTESINLRGIAWAEPNKNWLISKIRNVFSKLSDSWKNRLQSEDEAASKLAELTASEVWTLDLPKATIKS